MRQISWIAIASVLGFSLAGCNLFGGGDTATQPSPATPAPVAASPTGTPTPPAFASPTVKGQNGAANSANAPKGILPPDLISSTDPNQRVQEVQRSRSDPFSLVPTTPSVQLPPPLPTVSQPPSPSATASSGSSQSGGSSGQANQPARVTPSARSIPAIATAPSPPPPPQPILAKAVKVTGVVQVGGKLFAIVTAPNEPTSRYVQAGQRLSNGQVLVRRIEVNGSEPVVVFEQFGVEVVTAVGEGGPPATATPTPAAFLPSLPGINRQEPA